MPRVQIPVTKPAAAVNGAVQPGVTAGDPANDHYFENDGQTILQVKNTGAGVQILTIVTAQTLKSREVADDAPSFAAGETRILGAFDPALYGQPADSNRVYVNIGENSWELRAFSSAP